MSARTNLRRIFVVTQRLCLILSFIFLSSDSVNKTQHIPDGAREANTDHSAGRMVAAQRREDLSQLQAQHEWIVGRDKNWALMNE